MLAEEIIDVPAVAGELAAVHTALERFWGATQTGAVGTSDSDWRARFATAVWEVATNVVRHAYPPELRAPGRLRLRLRAYTDRAVASFVDRGVAFVDRGVASSRPLELSLGQDDDGLQELAEGSYGLPMVRNSVDRVDYRRTPDGANYWRLVKYFAPALDIAAP